MSTFPTCVLIAVSLFFCSTSSDQTSEGTVRPHIFDNPAFWQHFRSEVESRAWQCDFPSDLLQTTLLNDTALYSDPAPFLRRRREAQQWLTASNRWVSLVLGASKELAGKQPGKHCRELQELRMLEAFQDYVDHLDYFYKVADAMTTRGVPVRVFSQGSSRIHDIDKLDPVMMVGYSEKFEDGVNTEVWNKCVDRHTKTNPHHQAHCVWHPDTAGDDCPFCKGAREDALREMVCDKVSRRVQKNLGGEMSSAMWDVEMAFYAGLPKEWLEKAQELMLEMKNYSDEGV